MVLHKKKCGGGFPWEWSSGWVIDVGCLVVPLLSKQNLSATISKFNSHWIHVLSSSLFISFVMHKARYTWHRMSRARTKSSTHCTDIVWYSQRGENRLWYAEKVSACPHHSFAGTTNVFLRGLNCKCVTRHASSVPSVCRVRSIPVSYQWLLLYVRQNTSPAPYIELLWKINVYELVAVSTSSTPVSSWF